MIIGVDIDGVLADFNSAYIDLTIQLTDRDLFPPRPFDIPCWDYPEFYGYSEEEMNKVWEHIINSPVFWSKLSEYPTTKQALYTLGQRISVGDDIYFITSRPGKTAKRQTEEWLKSHWPYVIIPRQLTVLVCDGARDKADCIRALKIDKFIDDKIENVLATARNCKTYLLNRPWNQESANTKNLVGSFWITRVNHLPEMFL